MSLLACLLTFYRGLGQGVTPDRKRWGGEEGERENGWRRFEEVSEGYRGLMDGSTKRDE